MNVPKGQFDGSVSYTFIEVTSSITERKLLVNGSTEDFLILPGASALQVRLCTDKYLSWFQSDRNYQGSGRPSPALRREIERFKDVQTVEQFEVELLNFTHVGLRCRFGIADLKRATDFLMLLWAYQQICYPKECVSLLGRFEDVQILGLPNHPITTISRQFVKAYPGAKATVSLCRRLVVSAMLSISGIEEIGDLTPDALNGCLDGVKLAPGIANTLVVLMRDAYGPARVSFTRGDYGQFGHKVVKSDRSFAWAIEKDADMEEWRSVASEYMKTIKTKADDVRNGINLFLEYVIVNKEIPRSIILGLSSAQKWDPPFEEFSSDKRVIQSVFSFVEYIISTRFVAEDDNGHPYRLPGYRNPIAEVKQTGQGHSVTVRDAMPTRWVRRLREILTEDDYRWPKEAFESGADTIMWNHPDHGWTEIWSPVRTYAILMKLELPERTFQVRVANSGEADIDFYDYVSNTWSKNPHKLAGQTPYGHDMGVPRQLIDFRANATFTGLYFNTNKTGDLGKLPSQRGHVVPWQNETVLRLAGELRVWQEKYNPIERPTPWTMIPDIVDVGNSETLEDRGAETFLFRDPGRENPDHPVRHSRLQTFWVKLCAELEDRLRLEGEKSPAGDDFSLVYKDASGRPTSPVFDLHSLRVTMITALAEAGVPIEILVKVAGHATALMTLYYQKLSIGHVTEVLDKASAAMMLDEQGNWIAWLRSRSYEDLGPSVAHNDPAGPQALAASASAALVRQDAGICPVGCGKCNIGGPRISSTGRHAPVPGGSQNCVRCRFFITGPAFLLGLTALFDSLGHRYKVASRSYIDATDRFENLDYVRRQAVKCGEPFEQYSKLDALAAAVDQRTKEVDDIALSWHATYNLINSTLEIIRNGGENEDKNQLSLMRMVIARSNCSTGFVKHQISSLRSTPQCPICSACDDLMRS